MPLVKLQSFGGIRPKIDKRLLAPDGAQSAIDCFVDGGTIMPFLDRLQVETLAAEAQSIYPYHGHWLSWPGHVKVFHAPLADDQYQRILYTGSGAPKVRAVVAGTEREFNLGVPKPTAAPTPTVRASNSWLNWTATWGYFFEEPDGRKMQENANIDDLVVTSPGEAIYAGTDSEQPPPANSYHVAAPTRTAGSAESKFMPFMDGHDEETGAYLGRAYPTDSAYAGSSNLIVRGRKIVITPYIRDDTGIVNPPGEGIFLCLSLGLARATDNVQYNDCSWVYTFVNLFGEEGPPSDASDLIPMRLTQEAVLALPDNGSASANIATLVYKRIYRTVTSDAGTQYQYVGQCAVEATQFVDSVPDIDAGEVLPSIGFNPPPEDLDGLVAMPGAFFAGFVGRTVYFSEPNYPYAWPLQHALSMDGDIVGLGVSGNTLVVLTDGATYLLTAMDPATTSQLKLPVAQACSSARAIVEVAGVVVYPSPDGLVVVQPGSAIVFSQNAIDKETWQSYQPENMLGIAYDNNVYLFSPTVGLIFPIVEDMPRIVTTAERPTAVYYDPEEDRLYMASALNLFAWNAGATRKLAVWRSREYTFAKPTAPYIARVTAAGYPLILRLIANDTIVQVLSVADNEAFWVPQQRDEKFWAFEVVAGSEVTEVVLSQSMSDL